jgi:pilus assembly protein CpaB
MKNPKAIAMLVLSVVIGLVATIAASGWLAQQGRAASNKVVVAAVDIELGSRLNPQLLKTIDWPSGGLPAGAIADPQALQDRVVKTSIFRGEPVLEAKLAPLGSTGGLSAVIPAGKRAITVRVNDVVGVAGFALPGNYVDIVVSTQIEGEGTAERQISKIVLEHILVLAVAQEAGRDETKPKVVNAVTLEVTPDQAERLDLARSVGTLSLVLRNQMDKEGTETAGVMKRQLLTGDFLKPAEPTKPAKSRAAVHHRKPAAATQAPSPTLPTSKFTIEIIKGVQKATVAF